MTVAEEKIHPGMTIEEIFTKFPPKAQRLAQEMTNHGLHCVGCHASTWETLEAGMLSHGMSLADVGELVGKLNAILEEQVDLTAITLTRAAASKFLTILSDEKKSGWGLRFGLKPGGCSGYEYILDYSAKPSAQDRVFTSHGVEIHVEQSLVPKLLGCEIDYVEGLQNSGFKVTNPNVKSSCGCGSSQGY